MPNHQDDFDWNQSYTGEVADFAEADPELLKIIDGLPPGRALMSAAARADWSLPSLVGDGR